MLRKIYLVMLFFMLIVLMAYPDCFAQCPMCKMAAESNMKDGGTAGKGLNTGILYLLAMPYLAIMTLAIIWRKRNKIRNQ